VREGARRKDDTLPERFLREPIPTGGSKGKVVPLEQMIDEYYAARKWDKKTGIPTREKLHELGLMDVAVELEKLA
jgi:aldehyde:ferredoxin oxidoreductase